MKKNFIYIITIVIIYIFVLQDFLQQFIPLISYFDELFAFIAISIFITKFIKNKFRFKYDRESLRIFILILIITILGIISNIIYKYQVISSVLSDIIVFWKFFIVYLFSKKYINIKFIEENNKKILFHIKFIIIALLFLTILNYIFQFIPLSYRNGIAYNQLFYSHPTKLVAICVFLLAIFITLDDSYFNPYIFILLFLMISTLRTKAIGFCFVEIMIILFIKKSHKKISIQKIIFLGIIAIVLASKNINFYFIKNENFARSALTTTSIKIASDFFPLGSGFGTFVSHFSIEPYSKIYLIYGINDLYGLKYGNAIFVSDVFWPMIIGQFGYIGFIIYVYALILIFKNIQKNFYVNATGIYIAKITCLAYLIISSIAESSFVSPIAVPLAIIIGLNDNRLGLEEKE